MKRINYSLLFYVLTKILILLLFFEYAFYCCFIFSVNFIDGEVLHITRVSRLHMGAYLCIASNGVPPSISKRVTLKVQCKYIFILYLSHQLCILRNQNIMIVELKYTIGNAYVTL